MENLIIIICLLIAGYIAGRRAEARHYASIKKREEEWMHLPAVSHGEEIQDQRVIQSELVMGSVVISIDYFKRLLASLGNIFGGSVPAYETLIDRARREAILRMKEAAACATIIVNTRLETSSISKSTQKGSVGCIEVLAYGTALTMENKTD